MADTITLEQVRDQLRSEVELIERDRLQYPENAYRTSSSTLDDLADAIDAAIEQREQEAKVCVWSEDEDGNWDTGCGNIFVITEGTPYDNQMGFCCYCGHKLDQETQADSAMAKESGNE